MWSRYYDPETGRFINPDVYAATGQGLQGNNMFAYCGNSPVSRVDEIGQAWLAATVGGTIVGGLLSGTAELISQVANHVATGESINWGDVGISALNGAVYGGVMAATGSNVAASVASTATTTVVTGVRNGDSALKIVADTAMKTATAAATSAAPKIINKSLEGKYSKGPNYLADSTESSVSRSRNALLSAFGMLARDVLRSID